MRLNILILPDRWFDEAPKLNKLQCFLNCFTKLPQTRNRSYQHRTFRWPNSGLYPVQWSLENMRPELTALERIEPNQFPGVSSTQSLDLY
jgi:hypothetical protein